MAKDAVATMGMPLTDDVGGRDAVHVAVIAAVATGQLWPGDHVGLLKYNSYNGDPIADACEEPFIGIVDPFLPESIPHGSRFWLFLYPRTITGLSHRWTHPAFDDVGENKVYNTPSSKIDSEKWLRDFCGRSDCPRYKHVLEAATIVADGGVIGKWHDGEFLHFDGMDAHGEIPDEFWDHVEIVLGRKIKGRRAKSFSCSC